MRRVLAIMSAATAIGLAGCAASSTTGPVAGDGGAAPSAKAVQEAYASTTEPETAAVAFQQVIHIKDRAARTKAGGKVNFAKRQMKIELHTGGRTLKLRRLGRSLYVQYPSNAHAELPPGKEWVLIDMTKAGKKEFGATYGRMQQTMATNPMQPLSYLHGVSAASKAGSARVGGVRTTHYKVKVDLDELARQRNEAGQQFLRQVRKQIGSNTLPLDLWIDDQGRVRKEKISVRFRTPDEKKVRIDTTIRLSDFGTPMRVSAPPKAKTADVQAVVSRRD